MSAAWETFAHDADVGVRGRGATLGEAFARAATAMISVVTDPAGVREAQAVPIEVEADDVEVLLVEWLDALVYEMDRRRMVFARFDVEIAGGRLVATAHGEVVDVARHQPAVEVKGATFTELSVCRESDGGYLAQCVVDV